MFNYGDNVRFKVAHDRVPEGTTGRVMFCGNEYDNRCYVELDSVHRGCSNLNNLTQSGYGVVTDVDKLEKIEGSRFYGHNVAQHIKRKRGGELVFKSGLMSGYPFADKMPSEYDFVFVPNTNIVGIVINEPSDHHGLVADVLGLQQCDGGWGEPAAIRMDNNSFRFTECIVLDTENPAVAERIQQIFNNSLRTQCEYQSTRRRNRYFEYSYYNSMYEYVRERYPDSFLAGFNTLTCESCGERIRTNLAFRTETGFICENCYQRNYRQCGHCGTTFNRQNSPEWEMLCPECAKRHWVLPYHQYQPRLEFFGNDKDNTVPYMGVELEVDQGGENNDNVAKVMNAMNPDGKFFVYCSHDGSLHEGFEIITQPATLEYHTSIRDIYKRTFDMLKQYGYLSHDTSTCGLNVHFNRNFYADNEQLHITKLLYLVDKFWDEIIRFSRRNYRSIDRFSKKIERCDISHFVNDINKGGRGVSHDYHYYAINLLNESTIEFRMFRGTLNVDTYLATLQFVYNCILAAKHKTAEEIQSMDFEELIDGKMLRKYWSRRAGTEDTEE